MHVNSFEKLTRSEINNLQNDKPTLKTEQFIQDYVKEKKIQQHQVLYDDKFFHINLSVPLIFKTKDGDIIEFIKKISAGTYGEVFKILFNGKEHAMKISNLSNFKLNEIQILNLNSKFFIGLKYY